MDLSDLSLEYPMTPTCNAQRERLHSTALLECTQQVDPGLGLGYLQTPSQNAQMGRSTKVSWF